VTLLAASAHVHGYVDVLVLLMIAPFVGVALRSALDWTIKRWPW
jgi:hypothetical protein